MQVEQKSANEIRVGALLLVYSLSWNFPALREIAATGDGWTNEIVDEAMVEICKPTPVMLYSEKDAAALPEGFYFIPEPTPGIPSIYVNKHAVGEPMPVAKGRWYSPEAWKTTHQVETSEGAIAQEWS